VGPLGEAVVARWMRTFCAHPTSLEGLTTQSSARSLIPLHDTLTKTARVLDRCFEFLLWREGGRTEVHVSLSMEPSWNDLSDGEKQPRLREHR
jgi:hypothetical protein